MTQIKRQYGPARRPGELGVHSLDHFALTVPDMEKARAFYEAFGLDARSEGNALGLQTFNGLQRWGLLIEGPTKRMHHLSFGVFEDELDLFKRHVESVGVALLDPPAGIPSNGLWFRDHDGMLIELRAAPKTSPDAKSSGQFQSSPPGVAGAPKRSQSPFIRPTRLAHCLLFTRDVPSAVSFYSRVLGLRLSDRSGDDIAFMHGIHGSDHHLIAFARSNAPGLHHCSWDVRSLDEIGLGAMQMVGKGYRDGWGLGRHVLGSNYFHYVRDPWGSYSEYSCDMDYIPVDQNWIAGNHDAEDAFYVWGPNPPQDWTHNHEADQQKR
ncbi:VOC family protein [Bradyrhizobium sp. WSM3983]|uniref:VOC family protein n=1 Tax=Bradyrhizobium sp. WSM3983 TaxID=1038867 RepID=UPI000421DE7B|nr:VOC family protein [Bradyrhizobium sp. WSM3983]